MIQIKDGRNLKIITVDFRDDVAGLKEIVIKNAYPM